MIWPELAQRDRDVLSMRPSGHCPAPGAPPATIDPVAHAEGMVRALEAQLAAARLGSPGHSDAPWLYRTAGGSILSLADAAAFGPVDTLERARLCAALLLQHAEDPHSAPHSVLTRSVAAINTS